jgi:asparagine synthase (glutamine-hydrolysing)
LADFFLIRSDDPEVIAQVCLRVQRELRELVPDYLFDRIDGTSWSLITGRNPFTPYEVSRDADGTAVIFGSIYTSNGPKISDLLSPSAAFRNRAIREYCRHLNYGVAVSIEKNDILIAADWLGLYPVYHHCAGNTFIATSIPGLLRCWEAYKPMVDIQGLVGILLLAHSCLGHTMFKGLMRLRQGAVLKYDPSGRLIQEDLSLEPCAAIPKSMDEAVEVFDAALAAVVGEATRRTSPSVLLSGGLDSRIIAGYLHRSSGNDGLAISLGDRKDLEMRAAAGVAAAIGAVHERVSVDQEDYLGFARLALEHDAMSSGLYAFGEWAFSMAPRKPILTGFHGDPIMGASRIGVGKETLAEVHTFYAMFAAVNAWGLSPGLVRELVRDKDIDDIILSVWKQLREQYDSYPGQPWQRSRWFDIHHRQRFLVGRMPKIIALRSWPILPYVHPAVLQSAFATPLSLLADRKVQIELMLRKFPRLARLPFAANVAYQWYRIGPSRRHLWTPLIGRAKDALSWHWQKRVSHTEGRYFVRVFDFNGVGWRALREQARRLADESDQWLNRDLVLELIPPSSQRLPFDHPISAPQGRRTLIGAVLCSSQSFAAERPFPIGRTS